MQRSFILALTLVLIAVAVAFTYNRYAACPIPIHYAVGTLDDRFGLSTEEAQRILLEAEDVWERSIGDNVFQHDPGATELVVNFIFDERQARADAEASLREDLNQQQQESESIGETYTELANEYYDESETYEARFAAYEQRLNEYNQTVERYNAEGGAPPEVYDKLQAEAAWLDEESQALNQTARRLNDLAAQINALSEEGNQIIEQYNENVSQYNRSFGESTEFTQGDYTGDTINVYKFSDQEELRLVLAHEFGHALGIDHVEGPRSLMYYLMGQQPDEPVLSEYDEAAYAASCGMRARFLSFIN